MGYLISGVGGEATGQEKNHDPSKKQGDAASHRKGAFLEGQRGHSLSSGWYTAMLIFSEGRDKNASNVGTWNVLQRVKQGPL